MKEKISALQTACQKNIEKAATLQELDNIRVQVLGKKGELTELSKKMKDLSPEEKPQMGQLLNEVKTTINDLLDRKFAELNKKQKESQLKEEVIDITLPGRHVETGSYHPVTQTLNLVKEVFMDMGFDVAEGPEVEYVEYNFDKLNIPQSHPSRDLTDTFYIDDKVVLRTQTSPMQVRYMQEHKPPFRMISPGKVYRPDYDVSHTPMFHQVEGLVVGENISFADLKGILTHFIQKVFGEKKVRFRPHFFPFTEPSAEMDVECAVCHGAGCRMCKGSGWVEIMGCGMVNPKVLKDVGYDPDKVNGFAFGLGMERITALRYGIDNLRSLFENDMRFLMQFK